jgi:hypothetical protein
LFGNNTVQLEGSELCIAGMQVGFLMGLQVVCEFGGENERVESFMLGPVLAAPTRHKHHLGRCCWHESQQLCSVFVGYPDSSGAHNA